jgi:hypothetical protein
VNSRTAWLAATLKHKLLLLLLLGLLAIFTRHLAHY